MHIYSYPTVFALGHRAITGIFENPVLVEEKVDGSQFSFVYTSDGELVFRSKGKQLIMDAVEKMFERAVENIEARKDLLHRDWVYRCEYLEKPHHNTLSYSRIPNNYLIGFDISTGLETYLSYPEKKTEFDRIGLECVPLLYEGKIDNVDQFMPFLERESVLGGTTIEGVVVKNYTLFTSEKKVAIGKYVSEKFKEVNVEEFRKANPTQTDVLEGLILRYRTPARWQKAVQHLRERGELESSPRDIGKLIIEVQIDTEKECEDEIKEILYKHFMPKVKRAIIAGLPEWYKEQLLASAFDSTV